MATDLPRGYEYKHKAHTLDTLFHPRSIAIIGASSQETADGDGWVARLLSFGFKGALYPINPKASEMLGIKVYPALRHVPNPVDYAILNVPAQATIEAIQQCGEKGVKLAHIYSSGFAEAGKEGDAFQRELVRHAKRGGIRLLGPNAMGLYYPAVGITFDRNFPTIPGKIAFASQSGSCAMRVVRQGALRGLRFSKVISYGNAADLNEKDLAEYLAQDRENSVLAFYVESVKDGEGFLQAIRRCASSKPTILLRGGVTVGGRRAADAHTGSGSLPTEATFEEIPGLAVVESLEELIDCLGAFQALEKSFGRRVAVVGRGAGLGVKITDTLEKNGFSVPQMALSLQKRLLNISPAPGAMVVNPIEPPGPLPVWATFLDRALPVLDHVRGIDLVLLNLTLDIHAGMGTDGSAHIAEVTAILMDVAPKMNKPVVVLLDLGGNIETVNMAWELREQLGRLGIPVFSSAESAAKSLAHALRWFTERGKSVSA